MTAQRQRKKWREGGDRGEMGIERGALAPLWRQREEAAATRLEELLSLSARATGTDGAGADACVEPPELDKEAGWRGSGLALFSGEGGAREQGEVEGYALRLGIEERETRGSGAGSSSPWLDAVYGDGAREETRESGGSREERWGAEEGDGGAAGGRWDREKGSLGLEGHQLGLGPA